MEKKGQLGAMGFSYPAWLQSTGADGVPRFDENKFEAKLAETAGIAVATLRGRYKKLLDEHPV